MKLQHAVWVAVVATVSASPAWAGVRFETKRGGESSTYALEGDYLRIDQQGGEGGGRTVLVDNDKRTLTLLNTKEKSFQTLKLSQLERMGGQDDARLQQALASLPPEQRKMVEAASKAHSGGSGAPSGDIKFETLNRKDKVAGYSCDWYKGTQGGKPFVEGCFIPWGTIGISAGDVAPLFKTVESLKALSARLGRGGDAMPNVDKAPGFPGLRVPIKADGSKGTEEKLVSFKKEVIPTSQVTIPADYQESNAPPRP